MQVWALLNATYLFLACGHSKEKNLFIYFIKSFSKTADYASPCHGDGTLRDLNSSSYTGDKLDRSQDAPGGNGTPWSPSWRFAFHTTHRCTSYQSPFRWLTWRIWQEVWVRDTAGDGRSPCRTARSWKLPRASNGLGGACGEEGCLLYCHLLLWVHQHYGIGGMVGSLWVGPKEGGTHQPSTPGEGAHS